MRVVQSWDRFNHRSSAKTWLWSIANNCIREHIRKQNRLPKVVPIDELIQASDALDPLLTIQLEQSFECLSLPQRQVFVERIVDEKSSAEAAADLGWSEAKVRTTLHRAVKKIEKWFTEGGERA